jgi:hypothetical protein
VRAAEVSGRGAVGGAAGAATLSEVEAEMRADRRGVARWRREGRAAAAAAAADEAGWVALSCTRDLRRWWSAPAGAGGRGSVRR